MSSSSSYNNNNNNNRTVASSVSSLRSGGVSSSSSRASSTTTANNSSSSSSTAALSVLANMMNQQAKLVQALAGDSNNSNSTITAATTTTSTTTSSSIDRLQREKQNLAAQVLSLQEQLNAFGGGSSSHHHHHRSSNSTTSSKSTSMSMASASSRSNNSGGSSSSSSNHHRRRGGWTNTTTTGSRSSRSRDSMSISLDDIPEMVLEEPTTPSSPPSPPLPLPATTTTTTSQPHQQQRCILPSAQSSEQDDYSLMNSTITTAFSQRRDEASTIDNSSFTSDPSSSTWRRNTDTTFSSAHCRRHSNPAAASSLHRYNQTRKNNNLLPEASKTTTRTTTTTDPTPTSRSSRISNNSGHTFPSETSTMYTSRSWDNPMTTGSTFASSSSRMMKTTASSTPTTSMDSTIDHTSFTHRSSSYNPPPPSTLGGNKSFATTTTPDGTSLTTWSSSPSAFPNTTTSDSLRSDGNQSTLNNNSTIATSQNFSHSSQLGHHSQPSQPLGFDDLTSLSGFESENTSLTWKTFGWSSLESSNHHDCRNKDSLPSLSTTSARRSLQSHDGSCNRGNTRSTTTKTATTTPARRIRGSRSNYGFEAPLADFCRPESPPGSQLWRSLAFLCTFLVPDSCIPRNGAGAKQAWREKVTICILVALLSALVVGGVGFLPVFLCRDSDLLTQQEIWSLEDGAALTTIFGRIYDMSSYMNRHPGGVDGIVDFLGNDASRLFPRTPPARMPAYCLNQEKGATYLAENEEPTCPLLTTLDRLQGHPCHDWLVGTREVEAQFRPYQAGELVIPAWRLGQNGMQWIQIGKTIYNVTQYMEGLKENVTAVTADPDHPNAYLYEPLHRLIVNLVNQDASDVYDVLFDTEEYKFCLDELFYEARIDNRYDPFCEKIGVLMYFFLFLITGLLAVQVLCSMFYLFRRHRQFKESDMEAGVVILVPCYNEGDNELRKTIDSCIKTNYPDESKVLMVVADGVITGSGEGYSTPETLAKILDFDMDLEDDPVFHYRSIGKNRDNYASLYTGVYEKEIDEELMSLKYIVVVKRGAPSERSSPRAGNRGKRDSQLIVQGMLNRIHHNRKPFDLDIALVKALYGQGLPVKDVEYLMCIDADTRVDTDSIAHLVYSMEKDKSILACCGETQVDNKAQSWVTMIQIFEYYSSHHLKKAFESVFGCVTCLPGCFTMYRIFTDDMRSLIGDDRVFQDYARTDIPSLHEKNLFELGEDRMLTTLLLQYFPGMKLSFVPEAVCWTIVPHTMTILLSQRRRWINSTFHNMYELLKVNTMCGLAVFSMKMVVIMDLLVTMILPASLAYVVYLSYLFITEPQTIDQFVLIFYAVTFSLQMLSFIMRSRWDYLLWFVIFCIAGIPVFYFILPLYSFINMDDFSWGKTRKVGGNKAEEDPEKKTPDLSMTSEADFSASSVSSPSRRPSSRALSLGGSSGNHTGSTTVGLGNHATPSEREESEEDDDDDPTGPPNHSNHQRRGVTRMNSDPGLRGRPRSVMMSCSDMRTTSSLASSSCNQGHRIESANDFVSLPGGSSLSASSSSNLRAMRPTGMDYEAYRAFL